MALKYLAGYPLEVCAKVEAMLSQGHLPAYLRQKYPFAHAVKTDKALYEFTQSIKNQTMRQSEPLSKVVYDDKLDVLHQALGLHTTISRIQGSKLKAKREIRIGSVFKQAPEAFLRMIVVHELAHLREREHNKGFYQLCRHMEPDYHQLEFDLRVYLTCLDSGVALYE